MLKQVGSIILAAALIAPLGGCLEECPKCVNGYRVETKTEYRYIFPSDEWNETGKDTILDGATRVRTWILKDDRRIEVRCFRHADLKPQHDLRYSIQLPLLSKVFQPLSELVGESKLVVNVDGSTVASLDARFNKHEWGVSFLSEVDAELIAKIASAQKTIIIAPRNKDGKLDDVIEFGVAKLADHIKPVQAACALIANKPTITPSETTAPSTETGAE